MEILIPICLAMPWDAKKTGGKDHDSHTSSLKREAARGVIHRCSTPRSIIIAPWDFNSVGNHWGPALQAPNVSCSSRIQDLTGIFTHQLVQHNLQLSQAIRRDGTHYGWLRGVLVKCMIRYKQLYTWPGTPCGLLSSQGKTTRHVHMAAQPEAEPLYTSQAMWFELLHLHCQSFSNLLWLSFPWTSGFGILCQRFECWRVQLQQLAVEEVAQPRDISSWLNMPGAVRCSIGLGARASCGSVDRLLFCMFQVASRNHQKSPSNFQCLVFQGTFPHFFEPVMFSCELNFCLLIWFIMVNHNQLINKLIIKLLVSRISRRIVIDHKVS